MVKRKSNTHLGIDQHGLKPPVINLHPALDLAAFDLPLTATHRIFYRVGTAQYQVSVKVKIPPCFNGRVDGR
jgi:hypothetical protein